MDGNRKFRSRALIIKTAIRFIGKTRRKSLFSAENRSSESLSSSLSLSYSPTLSKSSPHQQEKYQKRKLSMSKVRVSI